MKEALYALCLEIETIEEVVESFKLPKEQHNKLLDALNELHRKLADLADSLHEDAL
jgi:succinate dehydrogenase/fumarate reductase-like Fe-S protein